MHELGVVFYVVDEIKAVAQKNNIQHVKSVTIELGEVSTVIPYYLKDCFKWAVSKEEILCGCEMKIETIPAVTFCEDCHKEYETVKYAKICPYCHSENTFLVRGNEFNIKEIEVEEAE